jgi:hypothetical protein
MPSPFPGMDPWLEDPEIFPNFHHRLSILIEDALNERLPKGYIARGKSRVLVGTSGSREPDVSTTTRRTKPQKQFTDTVLTGMTAVGIALTDADPFEETAVEIVTVPGRRLVTAVEILSPANKLSGKNRRAQYRKKQREYIRGGVHLVEIDLLRKGPHTTAVPEELLAGTFPSYDYHVSTRLASDPAKFFVAGIRLQQPLPSIGIPLDAGQKPIDIALQPMLEAAYLRGRYADDIDYAQPPEYPLTPKQQAWAEAILNRNPKLKP